MTTVKAFAEMTPEERRAKFAAIEARSKAQRRRIETLVQLGERPILFDLGGHEHQIGLVHKDPSKPDRWRMTRLLFDCHTPVGHSEAATFAEALGAARDYGADMINGELPLSIRPAKFL